jgi:hypothetical protein
MPGHGEKEPHLRQAAVAALLVEPTVEKAAAKVGVDVKTLYRWLRKPAFRAAYRKARAVVVEGAVAALQRACNEAVEALKRNLGCRHPPSEIRAAVAILEQSLRAVELLDLAERVERLERRRRKAAAP